MISMSDQSNSPFSSLLVEVNATLKRAAESLKLALDGIPPVEDVAQLAYVRRQAQSVISVAHDVHLLVSHQRFQNVVGLCRIGFESRIHIYAAMRVPDFAAQKYLAQAKGNVDEAEEITKSGFHSATFQKELEEQRRLLSQMRQDFGGVRERKWKICEAAKAGGLMADYEAHYSLLSKAAHNTPTGLTAKDDPRILVSSVLRLLLDTVETCACLVFFRERDDGSPQPLTKNWEELIEPIENLQREYGKLAKVLDERFREEMNAANAKEDRE